VKSRKRQVRKLVRNQDNAKATSYQISAVVFCRQRTLQNWTPS